MFRALATHMRLLGKRGCARTAWAVGKLLLSMDPLSDPMGALLCVGAQTRAHAAFRGPRALPLMQVMVTAPHCATADYYAVRAHEDAWLAELVTSNACPRLVNLRFSVALALRNAGRGGGDEALATVLATFPRALAPLVLRCCGKGDDAAALPAEWREVLARPLFSDAMHAGAAGEATVWGSVAAAQRALDVEDKLVALFVERQRELWKWDAVRGAAAVPAAGASLTAPSRACAGDGVAAALRHASCRVARRHAGRLRAGPCPGPAAWLAAAPIHPIPRVGCVTGGRGGAGRGARACVCAPQSLTPAALQTCRTTRPRCGDRTWR